MWKTQFVGMFLRGTLNLNWTGVEILGAVISGVACWAESGSATRVALGGCFLSQCTIHIVIDLAPPTRRQGVSGRLFLLRPRSDCSCSVAWRGVQHFSQHMRRKDVSQGKISLFSVIMTCTAEKTMKRVRTHSVMYRIFQVAHPKVTLILKNESSLKAFRHVLAD